jgi:hypothetical protein
LGLWPRPAVQARPMRRERQREIPCACFALESCDADLGSGSRVCCTAADKGIDAAGATALAAALQKNTTVTTVKLICARACSGGRGG